MLDTDAHGIESTATGVTIRVYVTPRASANKVKGTHNREIKIALAAPPVDGAANKALVEFVAKTLGVPKGTVSLLSGKTSRHKVLLVQGVGAEAVLRKFNLSE